MKLSEKLIKKIEEQNWCVYEDESDYVTLSHYSPAGED